MVKLVSIVSNNPARRSTTYLGDDGQEYTLRGDLSQRANNPGNISPTGKTARSRYETDYGAIGYLPSSNGPPVAVFPDLDSGVAAQKYLWSTPRYQNKTLGAAAASWAESPYVGTLAAAAGVTADTKVRDLTPQQMSAILTAQAGAEGGRRLTVTDANGARIDAAQFRGTTQTAQQAIERALGISAAPNATAYAPSPGTPKARIAAAREETRLQQRAAQRAALRSLPGSPMADLGSVAAEVSPRLASGPSGEEGVFLPQAVPDPGSDFIQFDAANRMNQQGLGALLGKSFPMTVANPSLPPPQGPAPATQSAALAASRGGAPQAEPAKPEVKKPAATAVLPSGKTVEIGRTYSFGGQTYVGGVDEKGVGTLNKVNIGILSEAGKPTMVGKAVDAEIKKAVTSGVEQVGPAAQSAAAAVGAVASDVAGRVGNLFGGLFGGKAEPAPTRKLLTTDRSGNRVLIDAPNTRTGKLSDEYTKPSARARVAAAKATATRTASLPKLADPGSERTGMLSAESSRKVQPASSSTPAPLSFAKPIPPAIPTAQAVRQRVTIAPRAKPVLSAPGAGLTAAQKAAFGGYSAPNAVKEMAPLSAPGAGLTAAQKAAFGGYSPTKPVKPAKVTTQTVAPQPMPNMRGADRTPKLAVTKQGQPVSMVPKTGYEKPQARVATPRTILPAKPPTPTFVSATGQALTPTQVRQYNPDTGTFETKTVYRASSTAGAKLAEPRTEGTNVFGEDNAFQPKSVQESVRFQTGY